MEKFNFEKVVNERIGKHFATVYNFIKTNEEIIKKNAIEFGVIKELEWYNKIEKLSEEKAELLQKLIDLSSKFYKILFSSVEIDVFSKKYHDFSFYVQVYIANIIIEKYNSLE